MPLTIDNPRLAKRNSHERDANIQFFDEGHIYKILTDPDTKYTSVTTWTGQQFGHFDPDTAIKAMMNGRKWKPGHECWGMTPDQIKEKWAQKGRDSAEAGTNLHYSIECFMNCSDTAATHAELAAEWGDRPGEAATEGDWAMFRQYVADLPDMRPYRTEWLVFDDELKISGSIDMVYQNADGSLSIYDWKRVGGLTKEADNWPKYSKNPELSTLLDNKWWHYALQLNIYRYLLQKNYGVTVRDLTLVQIHPTEESYVLHPLPIMDEEIGILVKQRQAALMGK